jgi:hypothetical protein
VITRRSARALAGVTPDRRLLLSSLTAGPGSRIVVDGTAGPWSPGPPCRSHRPATSWLRTRWRGASRAAPRSRSRPPGGPRSR